MKIQLEPSSSPKQLRMIDLKPGDIAVIEQGDYMGAIVSVADHNGVKIACHIGNPNPFVYLEETSVRLLTPGECIRIVE